MRVAIQEIAPRDGPQMDPERVLAAMPKTI